MTGDVLSVGIAGCGWAGRRHGDVLADRDDATIAAVAEPAAEPRRECATAWGVPATFDGYGKMLGEADLDAVVIALPHHLHEDAAVTAAHHGIDVLVEKPIARTLAEADRMLDAAADAGIRIVVAESARYEPWTAAVDRHLAEGAIGTPLFATMNRLADYGGSYGYDRSEWLNDPERLGGGPWLLNGIHTVSVVRSWFEAPESGRPVRVTATDARTTDFDAPAGMEGSVAATIAYESGASARVVIGVETPHCDRFNDVRIHGTEGTIVVPQDRHELAIHRPDEPTTTETVADESPFPRQLGTFLAHGRDGTPTRSDGRRERNSLAVVRAGYRSIESGEAVRPDLRK